MLFRVGRIAMALGVVAAIVGFVALRRGAERDISIRPIGTPTGPVRITQFYATAGTVLSGQKTRVCYGVENARSVRISPDIDDVYPSPSRCVEVVPERTTHFTILAEGFDGAMATRSFTVAVHAPVVTPQPVQYAEF
jgi:hypothetical protein